VGSVAKNVLARGFKVSEPNRAWVTDITYIRTYDGFMYLAVVLDLFSRQVVGWATRPTQHTDLVLQALLAAVWRRKPAPGLLLHCDQGTQLTSEDWQCFLREHDIVCSMSRRGNCHDNAAMESFFQLLKRNGLSGGSTAITTRHAPMSSSTSKCFTTRHGDTVPMAACPR